VVGANANPQGHLASFNEVTSSAIEMAMKMMLAIWLPRFSGLLFYQQLTKKKVDCQVFFLDAKLLSNVFSLLC